MWSPLRGLLNVDLCRSAKTGMTRITYFCSCCAVAYLTLLILAALAFFPDHTPNAAPPCLLEQTLSNSVAILLSPLVFLVEHFHGESQIRIYLPMVEGSALNNQHRCCGWKRVGVGTRHGAEIEVVGEDWLGLVRTGAKSAGGDRHGDGKPTRHQSNIDYRGLPL